MVIGRRFEELGGMVGGQVKERGATCTKKIFFFSVAFMGITLL